MNKPRLRLRLQADAAALPAIAYRDGGATAVGLVGLLRMAPSALIAPLVTPLADRGRRERVLIGVSTVRGITTRGGWTRRRCRRPSGDCLSPRHSNSGVHQSRRCVRGRICGLASSSSRAAAIGLCGSAQASSTTGRSFDGRRSRGCPSHHWQSRPGDVHRLRHGADIYAGCTDRLHCRRSTRSATYRRARCWNTDRCHWRWCSGRLSYCIPVSGIAAAC
jgi:hypothetical protein